MVFPFFELEHNHTASGVLLASLLTVVVSATLHTMEVRTCLLSLVKAVNCEVLTHLHSHVETRFTKPYTVSTVEFVSPVGSIVCNGKMKAPPLSPPSSQRHETCCFALER
jgi:hypothetical protein